MMIMTMMIMYDADYDDYRYTDMSEGKYASLIPTR